MAKIRFKLKAHTKKVRQIKLDMDSLLIPAVLDSYRDSLHSLLPASLDDLNIETAWSSICNEISAAATRPLPKKGPAHKPWLSPKSLAFIAKSANCRSRKMMKSANKAVKKSVRANKVAYFRRLADEVQAVDEIGNTRIVYKTIRSISGECSRCSEVLKNSNGKAKPSLTAMKRSKSGQHILGHSGTILPTTQPISIRESLMSLPKPNTLSQ